MRLLLLTVLAIGTICNQLEALCDPIFAQVIDEHLTTYPPQSTPKQKAQYLSADIATLAKKALARGMTLSHYQPKKNSRTGGPWMTASAIWEGESVGIPLTFFVYAWPAENIALAIDPASRHHASNIHKHPIPCAVTILKGNLIQENYIPVSGQSENVAQFIGEELLREGDSEVDDLSSLFIHRLVCRDPEGQTCLSLHAYGLSSQDKVWETFTDTYNECAYKRTP